MTWWRRFRPSKATFPAPVIATTVFSVFMFSIWINIAATDEEMDRYGQSMVSALAQTTAGDLFDNERINLSLTAHYINALPAVAGITFYNDENEIIVTSGAQKSTDRYTAASILDDTTAGYVTIILDKQVFARQVPWLHLMLSLVAFLLTPIITVAILQLGARGNRSLPIVSVRKENEEEESVFVIALTLNNQYALARDAQTAAIEDAMAMAQEVCAVYPGIALSLGESGIIIVLAKKGLDGLSAVYAGFLIQQLLSEYETNGEFRCFMFESKSEINPAEVAQLKLEQLDNADDLNKSFTLASLAKANTLLIDQLVYNCLQEDERLWVKSFEHPILEDLNPANKIFIIPSLPERETTLIKEQATVILGFN